MKRRLCALAAVLVLVMTMTVHAAPAPDYPSQKHPDLQRHHRHLLHHSIRLWQRDRR